MKFVIIGINSRCLYCIRMTLKMASNQVGGNGNCIANGKQSKTDWNDKNYDIFVKYRLVSHHVKLDA